MNATALLKYGLSWAVPSEGVAGAWGARTIRYQDSFQIVGDRQSTVAPWTGGDKQVVRLLSEGALDIIRREVAQLVQEGAIIDGDAQAYIVNERALKGDVAVVSGNASYGYIYITAVLAQPSKFRSVRDEVRRLVEAHNQNLARRGRYGSRG